MSSVANVTPTTARLPVRAVASAVVELRVADLAGGISFRERGVDLDHARVLAESPDKWPPILVNRADRQVIDGQHRVAAARIIGRETVVADFFDGSLEEAYLEFFRRNAQHGLPLSLSERRHGARCILRQWTNWSDRRVASVCGLSPRTVASIRAEASASANPHPDRGSSQSERRIGRDGKLRPAKPMLRRESIAQALTASPSASLRAIARETGVSPETVRKVRSRLGAKAAGADDHEDRVETDLSEPARPTEKWWARDHALTSSSDGQRFVRWLSQSFIEETAWRRHMPALPRSRVYQLAAEARRRANAWTAFAEALEARARPGEPPHP